MFICACGKRGMKNGKTKSGNQRYRCKDGHSWVLESMGLGGLPRTGKTSGDRVRECRARKKKKLEGNP